MLSGSLNEPLGGLRNGGGNGRGVLFAKSANPVSNRKGSRGHESVSGGVSVPFSIGGGSDAASIRDRGSDCVKDARRGSDRRTHLVDVVVEGGVSEERGSLLIPATRPRATLRAHVEQPLSPLGFFSQAGRLRGCSCRTLYER